MACGRAACGRVGGRQSCSERAACGRAVVQRAGGRSCGVRAGSRVAVGWVGRQVVGGAVVAEP